MKLYSPLIMISLFGGYLSKPNSVQSSYFQSFKSSTSPLKIIMHSDFGGASHSNFMLEVSTSLMSAGHSVILAGSKDVIGFSKNYSLTSTITMEHSFVELLPKDMIKKRKSVRKGGQSFSSMAQSFADYFSAAYKASFKALEVIVNEEKPDILMCDFFALACKDLAVKLGVPMVVMLYTYESNIYRPGYLTFKQDDSPSYIHNTSLWNRFDNLIIAPYQEARDVKKLTNVVNTLRGKNNVPTIDAPFGDFYNHLVLANTFPGLEPAQALPPNLKMVGPIFPNKTQPLSEDLDRFLKNKSNVLYVGFGSVIGLDEKFINMVLTAFNQLLNETIVDGLVWGLGRTDKSNFPIQTLINDALVSKEYLTSNKFNLVHIESWAPQLQLLKHSSIKAFLSHGGLTSSMETSSTGTPVICLPFFGDQPRNCVKLEEAGVGLHLTNDNTLTQVKLYEALRYVLSNPSIKTSPIDKKKHNVTKWETDLKTMKLLAQFPYGFEPQYHPKNIAASEIIKLARLAQQCRPTSPYPLPNSSSIHSRSNRPCELKHLLPPYKFIQADNNNFYLNWDVYLLALLFILAPIILFMLVLKWLAKKSGLKAKTLKTFKWFWSGYSLVPNKRL